MEGTLRPRLRALTVALFPVLLAIAVLTRPYVGDFSERADVLGAVSDDGTRWVWAHLLAIGALGVGVLGAFSLRMRLHDAGEHVWSVLGVVGVTLGAAIHAFLAGAIGLGLFAGVQSGVTGERYLGTQHDWALGLFAVAALLFGIGWLLLAIGVLRSRIWPRAVSGELLVTVVAFGVAQVIPFGWAAYVMASAALLAFLPIAYEMWTATTRPKVMTMPRHTMA